MQYRTMGKTGVKVSNLGFGAMRLPILDNEMTKIDYATASQMLNEAIDAGVNYIDTAAVYHEGQSEVFIGDALAANGKRKDLVLATKLPTWSVYKPADCDTLLNEQLAKLKTDYIDFYLVHALTEDLWNRKKKHGILEFLDRAKKDGRIRHACFSFHDDLERFAPIVDEYDWDMVQIQYNYMDENYQAGTAGFEYLKKKETGIVIMEPLRGGNLARPFNPEIQAIFNSAKTRRKPADWALRWLWNKEFNGTVLSGMSTVEHVRENCAFAADAPAGCMSDEELAMIDKVRQVYAGMVNVPCTACGYCMPCKSADVNIPKVFNFWNEFAQYKENRDFISMQYSGFFGVGENAEKCIGCAACSVNCPQQIDIPAKLHEAHKALTGK